MNHNFNFHAKCEKLNLINLCFAYDLLLCARGDFISVKLMMEAFEMFSKSTGLRVNPAKCCIFFGGVDQNLKDDIRLLTGFEEGKLPFRYIGVPMSSRKLTIQNYSMLIDKIVGKIMHQRSRLLSYPRRLQLLKSVTFAITHYWMQCMLFPKCVISKINDICCVFLWTGGTEKSRKAHVAWKTVCRPKRHGGLKLIDLEIWSKTNLLKLL